MWPQGSHREKNAALEIYPDLHKERHKPLGSTSSLRPVTFCLFILLMKINSGMFGIGTASKESRLELTSAKQNNKF